MHPSNSILPRDLLIIIVVIVFWGLNFVPMIYALQDLTPIQLGAGRFLFSSLPFVWFVPRPQFPLRWLLLYAVTQGFGQFMCKRRTTHRLYNTAHIMNNQPLQFTTTLL